MRDYFNPGGRMAALLITPKRAIRENSYDCVRLASQRIPPKQIPSLRLAISQSHHHKNTEEKNRTSRKYYLRSK